LDSRKVRQRIVLFLVLTFLFSAILWSIIVRAGQLDARGQLYTLVLMWCPGIAALLTTLIARHDLRELGWKIGPARYLLISYALPVGYAGIAYGVTWLLGWGALTMQNVPAGQPLGIFILRNATLLFLLGGLPAALGEEIGWRGFLVPQLAQVTSFSNVALISGAIWAAWHYPLILFADYHTDTPRWFALLCFTVLIVGISFAFAWLRLRSGSLWTAAILHGSHNIFVQSIFDPLTRNTGLTSYITTEFGIGLAVMAVIVALFFWQRRSALPVLPAKMER